MQTIYDLLIKAREHEKDRGIVLASASEHGISSSVFKYDL